MDTIVKILSSPQNKIGSVFDHDKGQLIFLSNIEDFDPSHQSLIMPDKTLSIYSNVQRELAELEIAFLKETLSSSLEAVEELCILYEAIVLFLKEELSVEKESAYAYELNND